MKIKKEYLVLIGIVLISSLYLLFYNKGKIHYTLPVLTKLESNDIAHLTITNKDEKINLDLGKAGWRIGEENYKVVKTLMDNILKNLTVVDIIDLVSDSGNYKAYGLDDKTAVHVTAKDKNSNVLRDIFIGNQTAGGSFTYIKLSDDKNVYTIKGRVRNNFNVTTKKLVDKKVLSFNTGDILKINIKKNGKEMTFVKEEKDDSVKWKTEKGRNIETEKIDTYLNALAKTEFISYTHDAPAEAVITLTLSDKEGIHTLALSGKSDKGYTGTSSYAEKPFIIDERTGDEIFSTFDELKGELSRQ